MHYDPPDEVIMTDLSQYFEQDDKENCVRFIGDKLECFIPVRYKNENFLIVADKIQALGIFSIRINDTLTGGLQIPAVIQIDPTETYETTIDEEKYFVCVLTKNHRVMCSLDVMQIEKVGYFMWREFLSLGHFPSYINYQNVNSLFDDLKEITGRGLGANHAILEIILAHLFRDPDDLNIKYRHTPMVKPPAHVTLRDVSYGPSTTHSRIFGSYSDIGRNAALLNQSDTNSELSDLFRS